MVAAWINADTGVGPCIASGSQTYSGIWADLPVAPSSRNKVTAVMTGPPAANAPPALANTASKSSEPVWRKMRNIATRNPKSPIRFTMKAFLPASALTCSVNQKPINR